MEIDPNIEISEINENESTLPSKECIDGCKNPKEGKFKWMGCTNKEYDCKSFEKRINEGYKNGDWFHNTCISIDHKDVETTDYICQLCNEAEQSKSNNEILSETISTTTVRVKKQSKLNFRKKDGNDELNVDWLLETGSNNIKKQNKLTFTKKDGKDMSNVNKSSKPVKAKAK